MIVAQVADEMYNSAITKKELRGTKMHYEGNKEAKGYTKSISET